MNFRHVAALVVVAGCSGSVDVQGVGATSGESLNAGGGDAASATASSSVAAGSGGSADCSVGPPTKCQDGCPVEPGGACACGAVDTSPNCPAGWWKICCAGEGKPCDPPALPDGVQVIAACGPGPVPAWCVSQLYPCEGIPTP